jgi:hypothetical protein
VTLPKSRCRIGKMKARPLLPPLATERTLFRGKSRPLSFFVLCRIEARELQGDAINMTNAVELQHSNKVLTSIRSTRCIMGGCTASCKGTSARVSFFISSEFEGCRKCRVLVRVREFKMCWYLQKYNCHV